MNDDLTAVWVLKSASLFEPLGPTWWRKNGRYPGPMGSTARYKPMIFQSKYEAEEWLFKHHARHGRDTSFCKPWKIRIRTLLRMLEAGK